MAVPVIVREKLEFHKDIYRTLIKGLLQQRDSGEMCDIRLTIKGHCYFAHKAVLSASCPYFRSMFTSRMQEQNSTEIDLTRSIQIENEKSFLQILDFLYSGYIEITVYNAEDILRMADFLLLDDIKEYCRQFYINNGNLNVSNCVCLSFVAEQHELKDVALVAKNMVKARFHDYLIHSDNLLEVPADCLAKLFSDKDTVQYTSSDQLARLILKWMRYCYSERKMSLKMLLSCIDLQCLSQDVIILLLREEYVKDDGVIYTKLKSLQSPSKDGASCPVLLNSLQSMSMASEMQIQNDSEVSVLIAVNCHPGFHFIKFLVFSCNHKAWYSVNLNTEAVLQDLPPRLAIVSMIMETETVFCLLGHNLPYPSTLLRISVMLVNVLSGAHELLTFRHHTNQAECCQSTLTDDRSVPPAMVYCHGFLCVIGNREGTGTVYLCDLTKETYQCFQVPGVRFISLARAVVKGDRYVYLWCRHRYGHEEYCINKEVTFVRFDCFQKCFNNVPIPSPPGISYGEFSDPHMLQVENQMLLIHSPRKSSLNYDENLNEWVTFQRTLPSYPQIKSPADLPYHGYEVYACVKQKMYVLQNPAAYTTSITCLSADQSKVQPMVPPPLDGISLLTTGYLSLAGLQTLAPCDRFEDTFTKHVHNCASTVDCESDSSSSPCSNSDSDDEYEYDGYVYDDDIYGYVDEYEI